MPAALAFLASARALPVVHGARQCRALRSGADALSRLANLERGQLLVESPVAPALQAFLPRWREAIEGIKAPSRLRWHLEVDPLEF